MTDKCVIFAGGDTVSREVVDFSFAKNALVISADRGYELANSLGISSDLVIGDFDSMDKIPQNKNVRIFPVEKDDTDLMLAVKEGLAQDCKSFKIYGATGGRLDHTIGNIQSLMYLLSKDAVGEIVSDRERITLLKPGRYVFDRLDDHTLSLVSYSEKVTGLTIRGAKYEITDCVLTNEFPLGISNKIVAEQAAVDFSQGILLVIQSYCSD